MEYGPSWNAYGVLLAKVCFVHHHKQDAGEAKSSLSAKNILPVLLYFCQFVTTILFLDLLLARLVTMTMAM